MMLGEEWSVSASELGTWISGTLVLFHKKKLFRYPRKHYYLYTLRRRINGYKNYINSFATIKKNGVKVSLYPNSQEIEQKTITPAVYQQQLSNKQVILDLPFFNELLNSVYPVTANDIGSVLILVPILLRTPYQVMTPELWAQITKKYGLRATIETNIKYFIPAKPRKTEVVLSEETDDVDEFADACRTCGIGILPEGTREYHKYNISVPLSKLRPIGTPN